MLDITPLGAPPPTPLAETSSPITGRDAVEGHNVEPTGGDDRSTISGGWKLVEPPSRKVTIDVPGSDSSGQLRFFVMADGLVGPSSEPTSAISAEPGRLAPVGEGSDTPDDQQGSVRRRRTVPSGSTSRGGTRVLRKARRASSHSKFPSDSAEGFASS
jgi:hypothetical protein